MQDKGFLIKVGTAGATILVLVLILICLNYWPKKDVSNIALTAESQKLGQTQMTSPGQVAEGFPANLLSKDVTVTSSYSIPYPGKDGTVIHQYTIVGTSALTTDKLYQSYLTMLKDSGYQVVSSNNDMKNEKLARISAVNDRGNVSLVISKSVTNGKTEITASLMEK